MPEKLRLSGNGWLLEEGPTAAARRSVAGVDPFVDRLTKTRKAVIVRSFHASREGRRAAEPRSPLDITMPSAPGAAYLLIVRHPSRAVTFHFPEEAARKRRSAGAAATEVRFHVEFPQDQNEIVADARRSVASKAAKEFIKGVIVKITDKPVNKALGAAAKLWEIAKWRGRLQGWVRVTPRGLQTDALVAADFGLIQPDQRNLLLLHGTFSNTASAFRELVTTKGSNGQDFFTAVQGIYGRRIFGFNHFTVSKTPEQNARELLAQSPKLSKPATFDVITHSRGGLVVRELLEMNLGSASKGFQCGNVILVASPNTGTPLATGGRWKDYFQWIVNVAEVFPENAVTLGIEFATEALIWLAQRIKGFPGLESMDGRGDLISHLESTTGAPPQSSYSALVSNFQPKGAALIKLAEAASGSFFQSANDLVVPSEGGWRRTDTATLIPSDRIGCFGQGGNFDGPNEDSSVYHTNYFSQPKTVDFLREALTGTPHSFPPLEPMTKLPFGWRRGMGEAAPGEAIAPRAPSTVPEAPAAAVVQPPARFTVRPAPFAGEGRKVFQLFVMSSDDHLPPDIIKQMKNRTALVLATYENARALETVFVRGGQPTAGTTVGGHHKASSEEGGYLWHRIIQKSERIRSYVDGDPKALALPNRDELQEFGADLFAAIFPDSVRRLYDVARSEAESQGVRLDIVVTSMINWIADKPFEFAYDPDRQAYLATEDVNFTRNVLTAVPDERIPCRKPPMRMLVVAAQPVGLGLLSADEEETLIRRSFQDLELDGLVRVEVLLQATPEALHERLRSFADPGPTQEQFDIVHFIGHGEYRKQEDAGYLIFEDGNGGMHPVSAESLREILCHRGVRMVFLNACETGIAGRSKFPFDFNRGVAPKLVGGGIGVVVANQYKVLDVSATEFAKHFYRAIAQGATVGDAAREARVSVNYSIAGECIDWAVPVVYARDPALRIFEPASLPQTSARTRARMRPTLAPGVDRIGLWDVNNVIPSLESIAQKLNNQDRYHFDVADLSAPVGTWRLVPGKQQGKGPAPPQGIIQGDEVAKKLSSQASSLGYDRLFCITSFALGGNVQRQYLEGLALWNDDPEKRIAIISGARILPLINQGYPLGRFLANMIVSALCDDLEHKQGSRNCPNYSAKNARLLPDAAWRHYVAGKQKLCSKCTNRLAERKKALSAILNAF